MSAEPEPAKPAILCLHGGGTSGAIFNIQTLRLQMELQHKFKLVFLDAPFEVPPGPGVLPVFEGLEPYLAWTKRGEKSAQRAAETTEILERAIAEQVSTTGRHFVGVMGFSEGARVGSGLLLQQEQRELEGTQKRGDGFLFGVFLMGTSPPLLPNSSSLDAVQCISIPTLHIVGAEDPWQELSRDLWHDYSEEAVAKLIEFPIGHYLPVLREDTCRVAAAILRLYEETAR
ncbi:hypothetical protein MMC30_006242 [Trapelia coarctata]|nr:hypothetical protein [Trapelia coarctata]